jgi:hypothetical protein
MTMSTDLLTEKITVSLWMTVAVAGLMFILAMVIATLLWAEHVRRRQQRPLQHRLAGIAALLEEQAEKLDWEDPHHASTCRYAASELRVAAGVKAVREWSHS